MSLDDRSGLPVAGQLKTGLYAIARKGKHHMQNRIFHLGDQGFGGNDRIDGCSKRLIGDAKTDLPGLVIQTQVRSQIANG